MASRLNAVLCIGGASGAGKSTLAERISNRYAVPSAAFSDVLLTDAAHLGLEPSRRNLQELGMRRIEAGWSRFVSALTSTLGWPPPCPAVIEGIRHPEALDHCRDAAKTLPVFFIYLDVEYAARNDRLASRNEDVADAATVGSHAVESATPCLLDRADLVLRQGSAEDWLDKIAERLTAIGVVTPAVLRATGTVG